MTSKSWASLSRERFQQDKNQFEQVTHAATGV